MFLVCCNRGLVSNHPVVNIYWNQMSKSKCDKNNIKFLQYAKFCAHQNYGKLQLKNRSFILLLYRNSNGDGLVKTRVL